MNEISRDWGLMIPPLTEMTKNTTALHKVV